MGTRSGTSGTGGSRPAAFSQNWRISGRSAARSCEAIRSAAVAGLPRRILRRPRSPGNGMRSNALHLQRTGGFAGGRRSQDARARNPWAASLQKYIIHNYIDIQPRHLEWGSTLTAPSWTSKASFHVMAEIGNELLHTGRSVALHCGITGSHPGPFRDLPAAARRVLTRKTAIHIPAVRIPAALR